MDLGVAGFDWDEGNRDKCRKHGVALADIEAAFGQPMAVFPDPAHSQAEKRFIAIGSTAQGRYVFLRLHDAPAGRRDLCSPDQRALHAQEGSRAL